MGLYTEKTSLCLINTRYKAEFWICGGTDCDGGKMDWLDSTREAIEKGWTKVLDPSPMDMKVESKYIMLCPSCSK